MKNRLVERVARRVGRTLCRAWLVACMAAGLAGLTTGHAVAGQACRSVDITPQAQQTAFHAAAHLEAWLDAHGAQVAIIARRGQDLDRYDLTFSHAAFVVRDPRGSGWLVIHDLNRCGTAQANLFVQGLAQFYTDDLVSTETAVIVPSHEVQAALAAILMDNTARYRMHEASYSVVAYPFAQLHQNSNGWLLETYVNALHGGRLNDRTDAQQALIEAGYRPSVVIIGPLTRLGGRITAANVTFDDQPPALRWTNRITVNSGDSVLAFIATRGVPQEDCPHGNFASAVCLLHP